MHKLRTFLPHPLDRCRKLVGQRSDLLRFLDSREQPDRQAVYPDTGPRDLSGDRANRVGIAAGSHHLENHRLERLARV